MFATGENLYTTMHDELLSEAQQELSDREYYIQQGRRILAGLLFLAVQLLSWAIIIYLTATAIDTDKAITTFFQETFQYTVSSCSKGTCKSVASALTTTILNWPTVEHPGRNHALCGYSH